jgi:hypothetical protein
MGLVTLTHAVKSSGWLDTINAEADELNNALAFATWSNAGLTWVNGFSDQDSGRFSYATFTINGHQMVMISGQIKFTTALAAWTSVEVVKFPSSLQIDNAMMISGSLGITRNANSLVQYGLTGSALTVMPFQGDQSDAITTPPDNANWLPGVGILAMIK